MKDLEEKGVVLEDYYRETIENANVVAEKAEKQSDTADKKEKKKRKQLFGKKKATNE